MIQKLFVPSTLFGKRLIPERIVGLSLNATHVYAVVLEAQYKQFVVQQAISTEFEVETPATYKTHAQEACTKTMLAIGEYDQVHITIPSALVVLKELVFPFSDPQKIRQVLPLELESKLPFAIEDAILDFVLQPAENGQTGALVAAIRKQDLQEQLEFYQHAGIEPNIVSLDLFATHSVYTQIPQFAHITDGSALLEMGDQTTRLAFLIDDAIRLTRTLPKGIETLVQEIAAEAKTTTATVHEYLSEYGVQNTKNPLSPIVQKYVINYLNDIQFTLNSYSQTLKFYGAINAIVFSGAAHNIPEFTEFATRILQTPCSILDPRALLDAVHVASEVVPQHGWFEYTQALGLVLPAPRYAAFNMRRGQFELIDKPLEKKQVETAGILLLAMVVILGCVGYFQMHSLRSHRDRIQTFMINNLKQTILSPAQDILDPLTQIRLRNASTTLPAFLAATDRALEEQADIWLAVQRRSINPLQLLLDLTRTIDRSTYNIVVHSVTLRREKEDTALAEVTLTLRSKTTDNDWQAFTKFINGLSNTRYFTLGEYKEEPGDQGGVRVTLPLLQKKKS